MDINGSNHKLDTHGFSIVTDVYSTDEVLSLVDCIESATTNQDYLGTKEIFAIRQFVKKIPDIKHHIFNTNLISLLNHFFKSNYFLSKSIYFDKPPKSNWFVAYHQDLSISVNRKTELNDYNNWTFKKGLHGVHPPIKILENTLTLRIHLDDTTKDNGALKVIPKSHNKGVIRNNSENWKIDNEFICEVNKGSVMLMKPLLLHASNKTTNDKRRRVIHLEFNNNLLAKPLEWLEYDDNLNQKKEP